MAMRTAPTVTGAASGPSACAVPVVPKQTALRRTSTRGTCGIVPQCDTVSRHVRRNTFRHAEDRGGGTRRGRRDVRRRGRAGGARGRAVRAAGGGCAGRRAAGRRRAPARPAGPLRRVWRRARPVDPAGGQDASDRRSRSLAEGVVRSLVGGRGAPERRRAPRRWSSRSPGRRPCCRRSCGARRRSSRRAACASAGRRASACRTSRRAPRSPRCSGARRRSTSSPTSAPSRGASCA